MHCTDLCVEPCCFCLESSCRSFVCRSAFHIAFSLLLSVDSFGQTRWSRRTPPLKRRFASSGVLRVACVSSGLDQPGVLASFVEDVLADILNSRLQVFLVLRVSFLWLSLLPLLLPLSRSLLLLRLPLPSLPSPVVWSGCLQVRFFRLHKRSRRRNVSGQGKEVSRVGKKELTAVGRCEGRRCSGSGMFGCTFWARCALGARYHVVCTVVPSFLGSSCVVFVCPAIPAIPCCFRRQTLETQDVLEGHLLPGGTVIGACSAT